MSRIVRVLATLFAALSLVALSAPQLADADHSQTAGGAIGCCKLR